MMKYNFYIIIFIIFIFFENGYSQRNINVQQSDTNKLFLLIDNENFFKNNEYFGKIKEGYTMIGYLVTPTLIYYPSSKTKIEAGFHLLKYSGSDHFTSTLPVFRLHQGLSENINVILGTIYSGNDHGLIEPLYKIERHITNHIENGLQFLFDYKYVKSDIWLNWENFIFPNDTVQEEFTVGTSSKIVLTESGERIQLYVPVQTIITHKGGQINISDENLKTLANLSVGLGVKYNFSGNLLKSIGVENHFINYKDLSPVKLQAFNQGYGNYTKLIFENSHINLTQGFWYGSKFIAPRGEELFRSVSYSDTSYTENMRRLITTKLSYSKRFLKGVKIDVRFESYYDQRNQNLDYSYGIRLLFSERFFIKKLGD